MDFDLLFIIGGILYFLFRLFGGAKKNETEQKTPRTVAQASKKSLQERIEEAVQAIEDKIETSNASDKTKLEKVTPPSERAGSLSAADDVYAFHSISDKYGSVDKGGSQTAFSYQTSLDENAEEEYHSHGFSSFQLAQGISHTGEHTGDDIHVDIYDIQQGNVRHDLFATPADVRRAVITSEILGKPKSMQKR